MNYQKLDLARERKHIVVTWPKSRRLGTYIIELQRAKAAGAVVNFRLPTLPSWPSFDFRAVEVRCYRVHDGRVRGWLPIIGAEYRGAGQVSRVSSDPLHSEAPWWPPGNYVICDPDWHDISPQPKMLGFRGWRWYSEGD